MSGMGFGGMEEKIRRDDAKTLEQEAREAADFAAKFTEVIGTPPESLPKPPPDGFDYEWAYGGVTKKLRAKYAFQIDGPGDGEEYVYEVKMEFGPDDWRHDDFLLYCSSWKSSDCSLMNVDTEGTFGAAMEKIYGLLAAAAARDKEIEELRALLREACGILNDAIKTDETFWLEEMRGTNEDLTERIMLMVPPIPVETK